MLNSWQYLRCPGQTFDMAASFAKVMPLVPMWNERTLVPGPQAGSPG